jgi:hypothetical protein
VEAVQRAGIPKRVRERADMLHERYTRLIARLRKEGELKGEM